MKTTIVILILLIITFFLHSVTPQRRKGRGRRECVPKFVIQHNRYGRNVKYVYGIQTEAWKGLCKLRKNHKKCKKPYIKVKHNNKEITDRHPRIKLKRKRWSVEISIKNLKHSDNWTISCHTAYNSKKRGPHLKKKMKLILNVINCAPRLTPRNRNKRVQIPKLSTGEILCDANIRRGCPPPTRHFYFNDKPLDRSNLRYAITESGMLIYYFKQMDVGKYRCHLVNKYGSENITYNARLIRMSISTKRIKKDLLPPKRSERMRSIYFLPNMTMKDERVTEIDRGDRAAFRVFFCTTRDVHTTTRLYYKDPREPYGKRIFLRATNEIKLNVYVTKCPQNWNYSKCFYAYIRIFLSHLKKHGRGRYTCDISSKEFPNEKISWSYRPKVTYKSRRQKHNYTASSWSHWGSWNKCSYPCGPGFQKRYRRCTVHGQRTCKGYSYETKICKIKACNPVNGEWTHWGHWGPCSVTCGLGTSRRYRYCDNPYAFNGGKYCQGEDHELRKCKMKSCPAVNGGWDKWGPWSACRESCGRSVKTRQRLCNNPKPERGGKYCQGANINSRNCYNKECKIDAAFGQWNSWLSCHKRLNEKGNCGDWEQRRARQTNESRRQMKVEYRVCKKQRCRARNGNWSEWTAETCGAQTCGPRKIQEYRLCNKPPPTNGGKFCKGESYRFTIDNSKSCPSVNGQWARWDGWGVCSVTCGPGIRSRYRGCTQPNPRNGGTYCSGDRIENEICNLQSCPIVDGKWSPWGYWRSPRQVKQRRYRWCNNPSPANGGRICEGPKYQERQAM